MLKLSKSSCCKKMVVVVELKLELFSGKVGIGRKTLLEIGFTNLLHP